MHCMLENYVRAREFTGQVAFCWWRHPRKTSLGLYKIYMTVVLVKDTPTVVFSGMLYCLIVTYT